MVTHTLDPSAVIVESWRESRLVWLVQFMREAEHRPGRRRLISAGVMLTMPLFVLFAQVVPALTRPVLEKVETVLPYVNHPDDVRRLRALFELYLDGLVRVYRPYCLMRGQIDELIADIDDYLDDLEALDSGETLAWADELDAMLP